MVSYFVAGKADDPSFARVEMAARQIQTACPNIFFHFEMKHPDDWKEFINSVFKKYDFIGFPEEFGGPLVWTHEGQLIGGSAEFTQKVCMEKFGMPAPPPVTDDRFKAIAAANLKQVCFQLHREKHGPPFSERCEEARRTASEAGLIAPRVFAEQRRLVVSGACLEVWVDPGLQAERQQLNSLYGDGQSAEVPAGLLVGPMGREQSHMALLHPEPLVDRQLVLVPRRFVEEIASANVEPSAVSEGPRSTEDIEPKAFQIPPHGFRYEDGVVGPRDEDFMAAAETLLSLGGVVTWMGLPRTASEHRHPLDTHMQVLPFPVHSAGPDNPLRFPLELAMDQALKVGAKQLPLFPFIHVLEAVPLQRPPPRPKEEDVKNAWLAAYKSARQEARLADGDCFALAFTATWMLLVPLRPPDADDPSHEAWKILPTPHPCAFCGTILCPTVELGYPDTLGVSTAHLPLVSNRALVEGIPESAGDVRKQAERDVRVMARLLDAPIEMLSLWTIPAASA